MNLSYLPEFAALLAAHASDICKEPERLNDHIVGQQYIAARDRANRWMQEINRTSTTEGFSAESLLAGVHPLVDIAERVLVNDVLVRTWAAVLTLVDRVNDLQQYECFARNIHVSQMVIRHRALTRVQGSVAPTPREAEHIKTVRQKVERWTDMLLGQLDPEVRKEFAFQPDRADDFAKTYIRREDDRRYVWKLILSGLRNAFSNLVPDSSMVSRDDRRVLTSILAGLSPDITQLTPEELGPQVGSLKL